ncbi:MAG: hypothetical protein NPIRA05_22050 [Nitrospirales bacterium]|nr:MAG: hypothetical protein NPIRA05_22050 [Nitrospirales bacterium]
MDTTINNEYPAVAQVLGTYYDGLYHGNKEMLRQTFHPDARYVTISNGELLHLDMKSYLPKVEARESPASIGEPYGYTLESIEFAGAMTALVRMRSSMFGKHFIDFLSLIRVDGKWRIISKVFHDERQEPIRSK